MEVAPLGQDHPPWIKSQHSDEGLLFKGEDYGWVYENAAHGACVYEERKLLIGLADQCFVLAGFYITIYSILDGLILSDITIVSIVYIFMT